MAAAKFAASCRSSSSGTAVSVHAAPAVLDVVPGIPDPGRDARSDGWLQTLTIGDNQAHNQGPGSATSRAFSFGRRGEAATQRPEKPPRMLRCPPAAPGDGADPASRHGPADPRPPAASRTVSSSPNTEPRHSVLPPSVPIFDARSSPPQRAAGDVLSRNRVEFARARTIVTESVAIVPPVAKDRKLLLLIAAFGLMLIVYLLPSPPPLERAGNLIELPAKGQACLAIMVLAVTLWVTEALPFAVTSLLVLILIPGFRHRRLPVGRAGRIRRSGHHILHRRADAVGGVHPLRPRHPSRLHDSGDGGHADRSRAARLHHRRHLHLDVDYRHGRRRHAAARSASACCGTPNSSRGRAISAGR